MNKSSFKLSILLLWGLCISMYVHGQVLPIEKFISEMNKACPIRVDEKTTQTGYRYESGYVIIENVISVAMTQREMYSIYGSQEFRKELLKAYTQSRSIRTFTKMVIDANAGIKIVYTSVSKTTQTITFSPEEIRSNFYVNSAGINGDLAKDGVESWHNRGVSCLKSKDYKQAFSFFKKAAGQGFAASQTNLALCYEQGWGTEKDYYQAEYWYKKAIESGDRKDAPLNLGSLYVFQLPKYDEAVKYLKDLAEQGDVEAQCNIGIAFLRQKKYNDALDWEQRAANAGNHSAENNLGIWYLKGLFGFTIDYDKAMYWNERAAKAGKKAAQHNLRIAQFKKGEVLYNSSKFDEAFTLFMEAANNTENPIPGAFRKLSDCYRYGKGTGPNNQKAKYYWDEALKYNDEIAMEIMGIKEII